jgi:hypothetical protein
MGPGGPFSKKPPVRQHNTEHLSSLKKINPESYLLPLRSYTMPNYDSL